MKNKPVTNVCCLAVMAKKTLLILVNIENFYFELTFNTAIGQ